jgi:glycosyltransferase involved in cell wall biosynthesis
VKTPRVSIIIPAYHSSETISETLAGLREQTFRDFEVIIVNSSADEATRRIVEEEFPEAIFEQATRRLLMHAARNRGVARSRGDILVFTDPDCRPGNDWLERLIAAHDAGHQLVCGAIELSDDAEWGERGVHLCKYSFRLSGLRSGATWIAGTANASCSRDVWNSAGPFDGDRVAGDALFSWRAAALGCQAWFEPRAVVVHHYRGSVRALVTERLYRGDDFAATRMEFEGWSRARTVGHIIAFPAALTKVIARGFSEAVRARRGNTFLGTLPLQFAGHAAWLCGELRAYYGRVVQISRAKNAVTPLEAE